MHTARPKRHTVSRRGLWVLSVAAVAALLLPVGLLVPAEPFARP